MPDDVVQVGFRWPVEIRDALANAAASNRRSMSVLAELIVAEWLEERGWLDAEEKRKAKEAKR